MASGRPVARCRAVRGPLRCSRRGWRWPGARSGGCGGGAEKIGGSTPCIGLCTWRRDATPDRREPRSRAGRRRLGERRLPDARGRRRRSSRKQQRTEARLALSGGYRDAANHPRTDETKPRTDRTEMILKLIEPATKAGLAVSPRPLTSAVLGAFRLRVCARHLARLRQGPGGRRQGDSLGRAARSRAARKAKPDAQDIGNFCSSWRCVRSLAFFLIEVWQLVEFIDR